MASAAEAIVVMIAIPIATTMPDSQSSIDAPGLTTAAKATRPPSSASDRAAEREDAERQGEAVESRRHERVQDADDRSGDDRTADAVHVEPGQHGAQREQRRRVERDDDEAADHDAAHGDRRG